MLVNNVGDYLEKSNLIYFCTRKNFIVCNLIDIQNIFTEIREQQ